MKKYISLFFVGALVFSIFGLFRIVKAEENSGKLFQEFNLGVRNLKSEMGLKNEVNVEKDTEIKTEIKTEVEIKIEKMREEVKNLREMTKSKMEALRETLKNEKDETKAKMMEVRIVGREKALERFDVVVERMTELKDKVNSQITRLEVKNVDVTDAKSFVVTVEAKLNTAKIKITEMNAVLAVSTNQLSVEDKTKLRTLYKEVQTLIKETHQALNDAIKSLKNNLKIKIEANIKAETSSTSAEVNTTGAVEATQ